MTPEEIAAAQAEADRLAAEAATNTSKTPEQIAAEAEAARQTNAENASRRLLEAANKRIKEFEDAETERKRGELSEVDRLKQEAADAKAALETATLEGLRLKAGKDLPDEALGFLTGTDEATLTAQATALRNLFAPGAAGTVTRPGSSQGPSLDEQIATAEKAGNSISSIKLKMQKAQAG